MEQHNQNQDPSDLNPVSRKTNEEIDSDNDGSLIISGEKTENSDSLPSDGPVSQDLPKGKNGLAEQQTHAED
jgi:hypothetical protein